MEEDSASRSRTKRQKIDKSGRSAAFERLKSLKGKKNKCEIGEVENVYDEVDEKEYSRRVLQRQDEDWLEGPGDGYIEDGREIFDDDFETENESSKRSKTSKKKDVPGKQSKSILQMMATMPSKRKTVEDDAILDDLMGELCNETKNKPSKSETLSSKDYLRSISCAPTKNKIMKKRSETISSQLIQSDLGIQETKKKAEETKVMMHSPLDTFKCEDFPNETCEKNFKLDEICNASNRSINETEEEIELDFNFKIENHSDHLTLTEHNNQGIENCFEDLKVDAFAEDFEDPLVVEGKEKSTSLIQGKIMNDDTMHDDWENSGATVNVPLGYVTIDKSDLPVVKNEEGEKVFRFFWWDAYEDPIKQPGVVYLFGKVYHEGKKAFVSCCVSVENIQRRIFLLPREKKFDEKNKITKDAPVTLLDVYQEFNDKVANVHKIMNFKSRKVTRKYAFELKDVPEESEYLEIKYPSNYIKLSSNLSGETFSKVFGTNASSMEIFLLERKIKGPCWLEIKNPQVVKLSYSWCKVETRCLNPDDVIVCRKIFPPPPLLLMAINIRFMVNSKTMENEIVMISCLIHNDYRIDKAAPNPPFNSHFCAITRPTGMTWPHDFETYLPKYKKTQAIIHQTERSLLNFFLTKLYTVDPDVIIGHDLYGFALDTLIHRVQHFKVANWSRIGRLKRSVIPLLKGKQVDKNITCGRLVCDMNISAKELIRARSYDLDTLAKQVLNIKDDARQDYSAEEVVQKFEKTTSLFGLINATMADTSYILKLMYELNALPLALQITNIAGNIMSRTLLGGRSERNEYLLLHAFTEKDYLVPDKKFSKKETDADEDVEMAPKPGKKKPQYAGGLVLEPKKGFYDKYILLMDFNSLYPSIIQEYNICFTTMRRTDDDEGEPEIPSNNSPLGILPTEIQKLVKSRREVKALMKASDLNSEQYMQYNIRQMALKLTANSMYGCLGFSNSRFYAKSLAAMVTGKGREILTNTKDIVQKMNFEVIYGDTDSIMINTNCTQYDEVFKIGRGIKKEINNLYKYVELEIDGVFKYMLLLKKKKYAAVVLSKKPNGELVASQEYKGLDIVRRDWCQLSAEVGRHVLNQILSDLSPDERIANIRDHLERIAEDLRNKVVPTPLLAITKQLNKNPEDYPDKKFLPHLQVALRINSRGGKKFKSGDTVCYVICDNGTNLPPAQRAYHTDELKSNETLLIDVNYYLSQQIHPVVSRLCEPINGADSAFIAECLGLDPTSYKKSVTKNYEEENPEEEYTLITDSQYFKYCDKFSFLCINENCKTKIFMDGPMRDNHPALAKCRNPSCSTSPLEYLPSILNALNISIRQHIEKLYQNWMVCQDPGCPNRSQRVPMNFINSFPLCMLCKNGVMYREYRNADLYYQLKFYEFIFNIKRFKVQMQPELENAYNILHSRVVEVLDQSAYRILDFSKLFKFMIRNKKKKVLDVQKKQLIS